MRRLIGRSGSSANRCRWGLFLQGGGGSGRLGKYSPIASLLLEFTQDVNAKPRVSSSDRGRKATVVLWSISERKRKEREKKPPNPRGCGCAGAEDVDQLLSASAVEEHLCDGCSPFLGGTEPLLSGAELRSTQQRYARAHTHVHWRVCGPSHLYSGMFVVRVR